MVWETRWVGADDDGDCEHVFRMTGAVFASDAQVDNVCTLCGAVSVETSVTLNPGLGVTRD